MGKREIKTIRVPKWATILLLVVVSAGMAGAIRGLSGRAQVRERASIADILLTVARHPAEQPVVLAALAPIIADIFFFLPWGVLAFFAFDRSDRPRNRTYLTALVVGVAFALALVAWQRTLPTRVTSWTDAAWNAVGCAAGAMLGHARKRFHVRFE